MASVVGGIDGEGSEWWMERAQGVRALRVLEQVLWRIRRANMLQEG